MKLQTSLEFMLLLGAVSAFSVGIIALYENFAGLQSASYNALTTAENGTNTTYYAAAPSASEVRVYMLAPRTMQYGSWSQIEIAIISPKNYSAEVRVSSPGAYVSEASLSDNALSGFTTFYTYLKPEYPGVVAIHASYKVSGNGLSHVGAINESSIAVYANSSSGGTSTEAYSAYLKPGYEAALYNETPIGNLTYLTETNHCSYINWMGRQLSIQQQCGSAKWYFWTFSDPCYYNHGVMTATYCVYENNYPASLYSANPKPHYRYNISLIVINATARLKAYLPSHGLSSPLSYQNGTQAGSVTVSGIPSSSSQIAGFQVSMQGKNATGIVNASTYGEYIQSLNSIDGILGYYNGTGISQSEQDTLQQSMSMYNSMSGSLYASKTYVPQGCNYSLSGNYPFMECGLGSELEFQNISVEISGSAANQTIDYEVSLIEIR